MPPRGLKYIKQGVMLSRKREGGKVQVSGALEQEVSRPSGRRRPMCQHRNKPFTAAHPPLSLISPVFGAIPLCLPERRQGTRGGKR